MCFERFYCFCLCSRRSWMYLLSDEISLQFDSLPIWNIFHITHVAIRCSQLRFSVLMVFFSPFRPSRRTCSCQLLKKSSELLAESLDLVHALNTLLMFEHSIQIVRARTQNGYSVVFVCHVAAEFFGAHILNACHLHKIVMFETWLNASHPGIKMDVFAHFRVCRVCLFWFNVEINRKAPKWWANVKYMSAK